MKKYFKEMTQEEAKRLFDYRDGNLIWRPRPYDTFATEKAAKIWHTRFSGKVAGSLYKRGYIVISNYGDRYYAHRVIFVWHHDYLTEVIDHIDGDPLNNKIENLRPASDEQNSRNSKKPITNTSGYKGVSWCKQSNKWSARISLNNKTVHLGRFTNIEEAADCYKKASEEYYGEYQRIE